MQTLIDGIRHITDLDGYDHILFILALCAPFVLSDWRKIVLLATAFTIGHSVTLALSAMDVIRFSSRLIEFLIPITIMLTSIWNVVGERWIKLKSNSVRFLLMAGFGLIHGMGFSSYFRMMFNDTSEMVKNLFLFNLGLEAGQIVIIGIILLFVFAVSKVLHLQKLHLNIVMSFLAFCMSAYLLCENICGQ